MAIDPTESDIGRKVVYLVRSAMAGLHSDARVIDREEGVITSFNASNVFVRYGRHTHSQATNRNDLEWL